MTDRKIGSLIEFPYEKYGGHTVAMVQEGFNAGLFDTCKLFNHKGTRAGYEEIKEEAAQFAKSFVETYNAGIGEKKAMILLEKLVIALQFERSDCIPEYIREAHKLFEETREPKT